MEETFDIPEYKNPQEVLTWWAGAKRKRRDEEKYKDLSDFLALIPDHVLIREVFPYLTRGDLMGLRRLNQHYHDLIKISEYPIYEPKRDTLERNKLVHRKGSGENEMDHLQVYDDATFVVIQEGEQLIMVKKSSVTPYYIFISRILYFYPVFNAYSVQRLASSIK